MTFAKHWACALLAASALAACQAPPLQQGGLQDGARAAGGPSAPSAAATPAAPASDVAARLGRVAGPGEAAVLTAAGSSLQGARRLQGPEVRRLIFGNTLLRRSAGGAVTAIYIARNGEQSLRITNAAGQTVTDRGVASVDGDRVCARWERIAEGRQLCFAYFLRDSSVIVVDLSGQMSPTIFELTPGQPST